MAHLNTMQNPWNHSPQQPWMGSNFNGSNMSLNLPSQQFMLNNEMSGSGMWNPWMQQYPYPMMPNGKFFQLKLDFFSLE